MGQLGCLRYPKCPGTKDTFVYIKSERGLVDKRRNEEHFNI